jgi:hypothetical protein
MNKRNVLIPISKRGVVFILLSGLVISLSTCEKNAIAPAPIVLPAVVSYNGDIQPLFGLYCTMSGCHSGPNPSSRLDLTPVNSYNALFKRNEINISNPANSRLYTALSSPMPPWGKLIDYDTQIILKWIQQGAQNN